MCREGRNVDLFEIEALCYWNFEIEALDNGLFKNVYLIDTKILDISTRSQKLKFCDEFNHAIELLNYLGHIAQSSCPTALAQNTTIDCTKIG